MVTAEKTPLTSEEKKNREKLKGKAEEAKIVEGIQKILEPNEQLLAFTRGRIAGGWRGKLNVGPEAFFAPEVNLGLTERRVIMQHIHAVKGSPSDLAPHLFSLSLIHSIDFTEVETFSEDRACRIVLRLNRDQHFRIRISGISNVENARNLADVFNTITKNHSPVQTHPNYDFCPHCKNVLESAGKFCPFCGGKIESKMSDPAPEHADSTDYKDTPLAGPGENVWDYDAAPHVHGIPADDLGDSASEANEDPPISEFRVESETTDGHAGLSEEAGIVDEHPASADAPVTVEFTEDPAPSRSFWHQPEGEI